MKKLWQFYVLMTIPLVLIITLNFVIDLPATAVPLNGTLNEVQKQSVSILLESNKLLISFSLGIVGALSFFIKEHYLAKNKFTNAQVSVLALCGISCLMTVFFGLMIFSLIVEMLAHDLIDVLSPGVVFSVRAQYGCLLLAVSSLLLFVYLPFSSYEK